jgi:AMP-polyphosphate phosphotransferase
MGEGFDEREAPPAPPPRGKAYDAEIDRLREALLEAQAKLLEARDRALLIVISGVEGSGKGEVLNLLHHFLDVRHVRTHGFGTPTEDERARPLFLRYVDRVPPLGTVGVFFGSYYADAIAHGLHEGDEESFQHLLELIAKVEGMLAAERVSVLKLYLHLSKKQQKERLEALEADPHTAWRVSKGDWKLAKMHGRITEVAQRMVDATDAPHAPWKVIRAADPRARDLEAARLVLAALEAHVEPSTVSHVERPTPPPPLEPIAPFPKLKNGEYKDELKALQERLACLLRSDEFNASHSLVAAFEGMDAAGKGGAIRRVIDRMDARHYRVERVSAPTDEERARPYLWRFYRRFPRRGHATIFDRSWYGRVLVERVEGFAAEAEWARAYDEINLMEEEIVRSGVIVVKFWLEVSPDEQWRRFEERARVPYKRFKLTDEDLRNREKRPLYMEAAAEMLARNDTAWAPFHRVPGDDKKAARLEVLRKLVQAVEARLGAR